MATAMRTGTRARRPRRIVERLGVVVAALATVLASTVTAAPTLPGWVLLPLEAPGMPAHLTSRDLVPTERSRLGLQCREYTTGTWGGCSELIVRNTGGATMNFASLLNWTHGWWAQSPHHELWMRDSRYTHVGYGFAWSPTGVPYAVTVIAQKH